LSHDSLEPTEERKLPNGQRRKPLRSTVGKGPRGTGKRSQEGNRFLSPRFSRGGVPAHVTTAKKRSRGRVSGSTVIECSCTEGNTSHMGKQGCLAHYNEDVFSSVLVVRI